MTTNKLAQRRRRLSLSSKKSRRRRLRVECLEQRRLLAVDMGAIAGIAFVNDGESNPPVLVDPSGNLVAPGTPDAHGIQITLYQDSNSDGSFDAGDVVQAHTMTDLDGNYRFDNLAAGQYFLRQQSVPQLDQQDPVLVRVLNAVGVRESLIDDYSATSQLVTAAAGTTETSSVAASEVIGGERDIAVSNSSPSGQVSVLIEDVPATFSIGSLSADGTALIQYDGADGTEVLNPTGLGGASLAGGSPGDAVDTNSGLVILARADLAGDQLLIKVYTDAVNYSTATVDIPHDSVKLTETLVPFSSFTVAGGIGADFNNVGAIEASIDLSVNTDVVVSLVDSRRPAVLVQDFSNTKKYVDLVLSKTVDMEVVTAGVDQVTYTFIVTHSLGSKNDATGVTVTDVIPAGLTGISLNAPTASSTSYDAGVLTVEYDNLPLGNFVSFSFTASVNANASGIISNTGAVLSLEPDSAPSDNYDSASITVTPAVKPDLVQFAKHLSVAGVKLYGAAWCSFCTEQKQLFEDGSEFLPFIEVTNPDRSLNSTGVGENIETFPTWEFADGTRVTGVQTLQALSDLSGVAIPQGVNPSFLNVGNQIVQIGSPLHVPIDAYSPTGEALTVTVTVSDPSVVEATVLSGNRSIRIDLDGYDDMVFELFEQRAETASGRVIQLAEDGFYDGIIFHRVIDNFMIQGGDPTGTGTSGSSLGNFDDDFHPELQHNREGVLSFAKSSDDTNNSQFFVTEVPTRWLDYNHSVFGQLVEGSHVREAISGTAVNASNKPLNDVTITTIDVFNDTENSVIMFKPTGSLTGTTSVTVTVTDQSGNTSVESFDVTVTADTANSQPYLNDLPETVTSSVDTPAQLQLSSVDIEGDAVTYFGQSLSAAANGTVSVDSQSGEVTVTPASGFVGTITAQVGVAPGSGVIGNGASDADTQRVSFVFQADTLPAPTSIDLSTGSDSGSSNSDNITRTGSLSFLISGVTDGATVNIVETTSSTIIGTGTASGGNAIITTSNIAALGDGNYQLAAYQALGGVFSADSPTLSLIYDTTPPASVIATASTQANVGRAFTTDLISSEEGSGLLYAVVSGPSGLSISETTGVINWTPIASQLGDHDVQISLTDIAGNVRIETLTITVNEAPTAEVRLELTDLAGNEIESLKVGDSFLMKMIAVDARQLTNPGVYGAYADILFDSNLVQVESDTDIEYGSGFGVLQKGTVLSGEINELGAVSSSVQASNLAESLIATVQFKAIAGGTASFLSEPADDANSEFLMYGIDNEIEDSAIIYGSVTSTTDPLVELVEDSLTHYLPLASLFPDIGNRERLRFSAVSDNPEVVPDPEIVMSSDDRFGLNDSIGFAATRVDVVPDVEAFAKVQVNRSGDAIGLTTVDFTTIDGTAISGVDYVPTQGTLSFADGEVVKDILVPILAGSEPKAFSLDLFNATGGATIGLSSTEIFIGHQLPGKLVELLLTARTIEDRPIVPGVDGRINVGVGEAFDLEIAYDDLRVNQFLQPSVEIGVFQLLADIAVSQPNVLMPILNETQRLLFDSSLPIEVISGNIHSIEFSIPESPLGVSGGGLTYTSDAGVFGVNAVGEIGNALEAFGYTADQFEITQLDFGHGGDFGYQIHWTGDEFGNVDLPNVSVEVLTVSPGTITVPTNTVEYAPFLADGETPNPAAIRFNLNTYSRTFGNFEFYSNQYRGSFDAATGFDEVGGLGPVPLDGGGIPDLTADGSFVQPFDAFSLRVYLKSAVTDFVVSVNPGEDPEAMLLYGRDENVLQDSVLVESTDTNGNGVGEILFSTVKSVPTSLLITPAEDQSGSATITLTAIDPGPDNNFSTDSDNVFSTREIDVVVLPSPSNAMNDSFTRVAGASETLTITAAELLVNDALGNGESEASVSLIADATTKQGGLITKDNGIFTYHPPSPFFYGIDSFEYVLDDGGSVSHAEVTITSTLGEHLVVELEQGDANEVTLSVIDEQLVVYDDIAGQEISKLPIDTVPPFVLLVGASEDNNKIHFDRLAYSTLKTKGVTWHLQGGDADDEVTITGFSDDWAWLSSRPFPRKEWVVELRDLFSTTSTYSFNSIEGLRLQGIDRIDMSDPFLQLGSDQFVFDSLQPLRLTDSTTLAGGSVHSATQAVLLGGSSLIGNGAVHSSFAGNLGSLIRATGPLTLGSTEDVDGFRTDGRFEIGGNTVHLLDQNQAELGGATGIGDENAGVLVADNGLILDFGDNLQGFGFVNTNSSYPIINNGSIRGDSEQRPITINGSVKGVGSFDNVVMNGDFTPGFSPGRWQSGLVTYGDNSRIEIEIGGTVAGLEFDRVDHQLARLSGVLDVRLINGFTPELGQAFEILTSEFPFEGSFSDVLLPQLMGGVHLEAVFTDNQLRIEPVIKLGESSGTTQGGNDAFFGSRLKIVQSTLGHYEVANEHENQIVVQGNELKVVVSGNYSFDPNESWRNLKLELQDGHLVQVSTDGVNRLTVRGADWRNFINPSDINNDNLVSALDALALINELGSRAYSSGYDQVLEDSAILVTGEGHFYDQNGDGKCTALDALRVINDLARSSVSGEGETVTSDYLSGGSDAIWSQDMEFNEAPFESEYEETDLIYSDADPETSNASDRPEDLVYATVGQESTEAVDSLLSDLEDWWQ